MLETPPLSLYVHLPWCVRKCPYCDFNSHAAAGSLPFGRYVDALIADLEADLPLTWNRPLGSIYLGGGTPSLFPAAHIEALLGAVRARMVVRPDAEITLEANPGTVEHDSFGAYAEAGVNRVSLGAQTFDDGLLENIGRIHTAREICEALESLATSPIENFNLDLMYALPGQRRAQLRRDLATAIEAGAAHISLYQLTLEPNTAFAANPPELPGEDLAWEMQQRGAGMLAAAGYRQYEISAWARPGLRSRHNMNYWRYGDYLAIGAGAHGKVTLAAEDRIIRYAKHRHPRRYMRGTESGDWLAQRRDVEASERLFEFFLNQLRLKDGVSVDDFSARTGLAWSAAEDKVGLALDKGLLSMQGRRLVATELGWRFINDIQRVFLP
ncbi:MAG: radical SAM family heme chaperone HemW [Lysobacterales bacterium]